MFETSPAHHFARLAMYEPTRARDHRGRFVSMGCPKCGGSLVYNGECTEGWGRDYAGRTQWVCLTPIDSHNESVEYGVCDGIWIDGTNPDKAPPEYVPPDDEEEDDDDDWLEVEVDLEDAQQV